jgi:uncharacterized phage protein (TIGR01671 family)
MNRKIKFRVWDKLMKKYVTEVDDYELYISLDGDVKINEYGDMNTFFNRLILEQFTGLYDKNGKEIFEGDVIEVKDNMENAFIKCKVQYESGSFNAIPLEDGDLAYIMFYASQNGQIIRNIHEDKEE